MRLRNIKLSGFKSFVDPTTLSVPDSLTGIVGPNGCGKSNIIDAVTWVMGESSAKHLRGDSLTDVIFNGSGARQPVGQASVELTFENAEGKLGGQYASYSEISIKRTMNREGISNYYLNNSRCRRKDITGIFLGTGIGPRSYAIIEQGMISRLIDAKPEELRIFIEEAAGISKYRERRRETENRIRHTRDNIDRLTDIREELGKQLERLKRQAKAAERYQVLKQEERQLKAELLVLSWQELKKQISEKEEVTREKETKVEEGIARLRAVEAEIEKQRDELTNSNEAFNKAQSAFYEVGSDISQLEQRIQHTQERIQALSADIEQVAEAEQSVKVQQKNDDEELNKLKQMLVQLEPKLHGSRTDSDQAYDSLNQAEQAMQSWQTEWDAYNEALSEFNRQIEVDTTRLEHLQSGVASDEQRRLDLDKELEDASTHAYQEKATELLQRLNESEEKIRNARAETERNQQKVKRCREDAHKTGERLAGIRSEQQKLTGQISSLEALQEADSRGQEQTLEWLNARGLANAPRLIQQLNVEPEWTFALETVLGHHLQDICVDSVANPAQYLSGLSHDGIGLVGGNYKPADNPRPYTELLSKVNASVSLCGLLRGIYIASDHEQAIEMRDDLLAHESVITQDGVWLGPDWLRLSREKEGQSGALSREQQLQELKSKELAALEKLDQLQIEEQQSKQDLEQAEQQLDRVQKLVNDEQQNLNQIQSQHTEYKTRHEQVSLRVLKIREELDELDLNSGDDQHELESLRHNISRTQQDKQGLDQQGPRLIENREKHRQALENARGRWQSTHEQSSEIALQLESISSQRASLEQAIKRSEIQLSNHVSRRNELENLLTSSKAPLVSLQSDLEKRLEEKIRAEKNLAEMRTQVQSKETLLREKEQQRSELELKVQELRDELANAKMNAQETKVRLQTVAEQLQEQGHEIEEMLKQLDDEAEKVGWQERLEAVERKINRLGPINLAAIDEFEQLSERKEYLDKQDEDLAEALQTLETAIKKIDKETRTRFKETFDFLNTNLKEMFPVLFGGGHAYLEMTGDDLLETGVSIMARPPGKRNSTIHLLSGGEKALTAVALVFAIFKLNPAPFCILDEVDAPLDDTNTARFSELLKQMSSEVQFIFITHNKITMEIARQLLGVTMYEPGVSRLVSVNVDEAVEMAASA
ncbi:MAG: chromosome segregation protein SMC [Gammaproteobacteria bacterium]|nr:chromosome segregation protein SMC [Gammaproteobacteria bacterium]